MKRSHWFLLQAILLCGVVGLGQAPACAQNPSGAGASAKPAPAAKAAPEQPPAPVHVYRVKYVISELAEDKVINKRAYTLLALESRRSSYRVHGLVPFQYPDHNMRYKEVEVSIDTTIRHGRNLCAELQSGIVLLSSVPADQADQAKGWAIDRSDSANLDAMVPLGKPTVIGTMDDVVTLHQFQVEVTVTLLPQDE